MTGTLPDGWEDQPDMLWEEDDMQLLHIFGQARHWVTSPAAGLRHLVQEAFSAVVVPAPWPETVGARVAPTMEPEVPGTPASVGGSEVGAGAGTSKEEPRGAAKSRRWASAFSAVGEVSWAPHALWLLKHWLFTAVLPTILPLLMILLVDYMRGGREGYLVHFCILSALQLAATWRFVGIATGVWPSGLFAAMVFFVTLIIRLLALLSPDRFMALHVAAQWLPALYLPSTICTRRSCRLFVARFWLNVGFILLQVSLVLIKLMEGFVPGTLAGHGNPRSLSRASLSKAIPVSLWVCGGILMQLAGTFAWGRAVPPRNRIVVAFFFTVYIEVVLTTRGLQLFTGRALLTYAIWAAMVNLLQAARLWLAPMMCRPKRSDPVMQIIHLLLASLARYYGVFVSCVMSLVSSLIQVATHPRCNCRQDRQESDFLRAPTFCIGLEHLLFWLACIIVLNIGTIAVLRIAVSHLSSATGNTQLSPTPMHSAGRPAARTTLSFILAIVRTCIQSADLEIWLVIGINTLTMAGMWFTQGSRQRSAFWQSWDELNSWYSRA